MRVRVRAGARARARAGGRGRGGYPEPGCTSRSRRTRYKDGKSPTIPRSKIPQPNLKGSKLKIRWERLTLLSTQLKTHTVPPAPP